MKKIFLISWLLVLNLSMYSIINDSSEINKYVYYHYKVGDIDSYVGLLYVEKNIYLLRILNKKNNKDMFIMMTIDKTKSGYDIKPDKTKGVDDEDSKQLFTTVFTLLMNVQERYRRINIKKFPEDIFINEKMGDEFEHKFSYWIPIFNLNYLMNKNENKYVMKLITFGVLNNLDDFLKFNDVQTSDLNGSDLKIEKKDKKATKIYKSEITLDDNWEKMEAIENTNEKSIGYKIRIRANRDAQLNVEEVIMNDSNYLTPVNLIKNILFFMQNRSYIYPESIEIKKINKYLSVSFKGIDKDTAINNYFIMVIKQINKKELNVLNFSCFFSIYVNNKDYFDTIIKSIK